jgi:hypothetical protein
MRYPKISLGLVMHIASPLRRYSMVSPSSISSTVIDTILIVSRYAGVEDLLTFSEDLSLILLEGLIFFAVGSAMCGAANNIE